MSILNDDRRYGTDQEREEWESELKWEYRNEYQPDYPFKTTRYCEECEFCKPAKRFIQEIVTREADGAQVLRQTENYCWMDVCIKDTEHIREIHRWDEICNDHGELCERVEE